MSTKDNPDSLFNNEIKEMRKQMEILREDVRNALGAPKQQEIPPEVALTAVVPLPVPRIVVTILAPTAQEAVEQLRTIPQSVPDRVARQPVQIELRLDPLQSDEDKAQATFLVARLGVPVIITYRSVKEGGKGKSTDEQRQTLLLRIFESLSEPFPPGSLIDVEATSLAQDPEGWGPVLKAARAKQLNLLLSHHDFNGTPVDPDRLLPPVEMLEKAPGGPALLYKSATRTRSWEEELSLMACLRKANQKKRQWALVGMGRPTTRLLAPFFGAPLTYATTPGTPPAAPGQVPFDALLDTWCRWGITYEDSGLLGEGPEAPPRLALLGRPAMHSLSPAMMNKAAQHEGLPHRYFPLQPPHGLDDKEALEQTLRWLPRLGVIGGSVTAPFKEELVKVADILEGPAEALGAGNTYRFDEDQLVVTNTDVDGIRRPLEEAGVPIEEAKVLVLGAGGAAAAAVYALRDAARLQVTNRTQANAEALAKRFPDAGVEVVPWDDRTQAAQQATLIVQATILGMHGTPGEGESPLPPDALHDAQTVYELVYDPLETPLMRDAKQAGAHVIDGLQMLVAQGAGGYRFWTGKEPPVDVMREAVQRCSEIALPTVVEEAMREKTDAEGDDGNSGDRQKDTQKERMKGEDKGKENHAMKGERKEEST